MVGDWEHSGIRLLERRLRGDFLWSTSMSMGKTQQMFQAENKPIIKSSGWLLMLHIQNRSQVKKFKVINHYKLG